METAMKTQKIALTSAVLLALAGCVSQPPNFRLPTDVPSAFDTRIAARVVIVYEQAPDNATSMGKLTAMRCQEGTGAVMNDRILNDLRFQAYEMGANGISVRGITTEGGQQYNCAHLVVGKADVFSVPPIIAE
jgi:hypothetical protein